MGTCAAASAHTALGQAHLRKPKQPRRSTAERAGTAEQASLLHRDQGFQTESAVLGKVSVPGRALWEQVRKHKAKGFCLNSKVLTGGGDGRDAERPDTAQERRQVSQALKLCASVLVWSDGEDRTRALLTELQPRSVHHTPRSGFIFNTVQILYFPIKLKLLVIRQACVVPGS